MIRRAATKTDRVRPMLISVRLLRLAEDAAVALAPLMSELVWGRKDVIVRVRPSVLRRGAQHERGNWGAPRRRVAV